MGGSPPGAEVTGKLPPFDPCGPWVAGILRGPFARVCVPGLGPLPRYSLRREHFFPGFQQVLSGSVVTPPPHAAPGYGTVGHRGLPEKTPGRLAISGLRAFRVSPLGWPGAPGYGLWVGSQLSVPDDVLPGFLGRPSENPKSDY